MPAGDGTGPDGRGGFCTPLLRSGQISKPLQRGFNGRDMGKGRGLGWRRMNFTPSTTQPITHPVCPEQTSTKEEQKKVLEDELKVVETELRQIEEEKEEIEKRLKEIK